MKTWHVWYVNCDCASYYAAKLYLPKKWIRCRGCGNQLGDFQTEYRGKFKAATADDAIRMAKEHVKTASK